jgi:hypothetical protein
MNIDLKKLLAKLSRSDRILTAFNAFVSQTEIDGAKVKRKQNLESYKIRKINYKTIVPLNCNLSGHTCCKNKTLCINIFRLINGGVISITYFLTREYS